MLTCESHKNESISFCAEHEKWLCIDCYQNHCDHYLKTAKGSNKHVHGLIMQARGVAVEQRDLLEAKIKKIDLIVSKIQFKHDELKALFESID